MRTRVTSFAALLAVATVIFACGGDKGTTVEDVQVTALEASQQLSNYHVEAEAVVTQGALRATSRLTYRFASPGNAEFRSLSKIGDQTYESGAVIIDDTLWELDGSVWQEHHRGELQAAMLSPDLLWRLVPFSQARLQDGTPTVNGVSTRHYKLDGDGALSLDLLSAALLAGGSEGFSGDLEGYTLQLWTAVEGGWPVKLSLRAGGDGSTLTLAVNLIAANDSSLSIAPPQR